jgi:hypothetical protein
MQYGSLDAVLLNSRYLLFLVNDQIPIDIFSHLASHYIKNASLQSPLSEAEFQMQTTTSLKDMY